MSIYDSSATSTSFSLFNNSGEPDLSATSRFSRSSSKSAKVSPAVGSGVPADIPNVIGLNRINAINTLVAAGIDYLLTYITSGATSVNNDKVESQVLVDNVVQLSVYQYVAPTFAYSYTLANDIVHYYWKYLGQVWNQQVPQEFETIRTGNKTFTVSNITGQYSDFNGLTGTLSGGGFAYIVFGTFGDEILNRFGGGASFNYQTRFPGITFNWN